MRAGVVERDEAVRPAIDDDVARLEIEDAPLADGELALGEGAQPVAPGEALALVLRPRVERALDLGLETADLVERDALAGAAQARAHEVRALDLVLDQAVERLGNEKARAGLLVGALDAARGVDDVADGGQPLMAERADRAEHGLAVMQADADVE